MTSPKTSNKKTAVHTAPVSEPTPAEVPAATTPAKPVLVKPPPDNAHIPPVPAGVVPTNGADYRGIVPQKAELAVLGDAVIELRQAAPIFTAIFGKSMPSIDFIIQVFTAANLWSLMRNQTDAWDLYSRTQEGLTWTNARGLMVRMKPVFEQTVTGNADVATQFPSLKLLLDNAKVVAKRGAATRVANARAKEKGQEAPLKAANESASKVAGSATTQAQTVAPVTTETSQVAPSPATQPPATDAAAHVAPNGAAQS